jgi:hypothetical protein
MTVEKGKRRRTFRIVDGTVSISLSTAAGSNLPVSNAAAAFELQETPKQPSDQHTSPRLIRREGVTD